MSLNSDLAKLFSTMAAVMDIRGENPFKAIAFSKVSRIIDGLSIDLRQAVEDGSIGKIEGIGAGSRKIIEEYVKTGRSTDYEEVVASVPPGLLEMMDIPGLGPKTIALLWKERSIQSIQELVAAIEQGKLAGLKGIGQKKIDAIRQGIALRSQAGQRHGIVNAMAIAEPLLERVRKLPGVVQAEIAGSLRRGRETIGDVDLVCAIGPRAKGANVAAAFVAFPEIERILGQGETKASVVTAGGIQVDLRIVPAECFGAALLYFTGSKDHNVKLRGRAQDRGMTLNEWGLYRLEEYEKAEKETGKPPNLTAVAGKTEAEVYEALGLDYIEPELRENRGEVEAADRGAAEPVPAPRARKTTKRATTRDEAAEAQPSPKLPQLLTLADIRGDLHTHTSASDGAGTIEQMALAAIALGYEFLAITDHSQSQVIANGLSVERLMKHVKEIRAVAERVKPFRLLAGSEVDILADGRMDYEDAVLAELDFVVASPHSSLKQPEAKATDRILRAIENRYVTIIGHPTGRIIDRREGLPLNIARIVKAAAETGTALEINAAYPRLDLNDVHARAAIQAGAMLSINTDAHHPVEFESMRWGVTVARRAWATKRNVINCMSIAELEAFITRKRRG